MLVSKASQTKGSKAHIALHLCLDRVVTITVTAPRADQRLGCLFLGELFCEGCLFSGHSILQCRVQRNHVLVPIRFFDGGDAKGRCGLEVPRQWAVEDQRWVNGFHEQVDLMVQTSLAIRFGML